ncbi:MAG TPA: SRPBCC domain-containing protein [Pseudonocardia sp.]
MTATTATTTTQVFRVHIKATPERIWEAITTPEWTARYGYRGPAEYDLKPGGTFRTMANEGMKAFGAPDVVVEGEVLEVDPPRRLVQTWRLLFDARQAAEPLTRVTWEIEPMSAEVARLTVTHELDNAPVHLSLITGETLEGGGGWPYILSDLKSLLETGTALMSEP